MVTISTRVRRLPELLAIAEAHDNVFCSVGTHPHQADEETDITTDEIVRLAAPSQGGRDRRGGARLLLQEEHAGQPGRGLPPPHPRRAHHRPAARDPHPRRRRRHGPHPRRRSTRRAGRSPRSCIATPAARSWRSARVELGLYVSFTGVVVVQEVGRPARDRRRGAARPAAGRDRRAVPGARAVPRPDQRAGVRRAHGRGAGARTRRITPDALAAATTANFFRLFAKVPRTLAPRERAGMSYRLTILGCGSSTGVPRVGGDWGKCDPNNPKNRRRRCAALIEQRSGGPARRRC